MGLAVLYRHVTLYLKENFRIIFSTAVEIYDSCSNYHCSVPVNSQLCQNFFQCSITTYLLTPWSTVLLEKLTGFAANQEIPAFYGPRKIITILTSACHLSLSWSKTIQSPQPLPTSWRSSLSMELLSWPIKVNVSPADPYIINYKY